MRNFKFITFCGMLSFAFGNLKAQKDLDSNRLEIPEVNIKGYFSPEPLSNASLSVFFIDAEQLKSFDQNSFVPVLNTVPGIRMEERSPASYRLSIRGSLLRSPFGVRNVKVYFEDLPLTDAGGNTYLNALNLSSIYDLEVLKGPDGSVFGANSGGVVLLNAFQPPPDLKFVTLGFQVGSYSSGMQHLSLNQKIKKHVFQFRQSYQTAKGYRENSAMGRLNIQALDHWQYSEKGKLEALLFYGKLHYETPGGLTPEQYEKNPRWARQATATLPGAVEQKAGVFNDLWFGGLRHVFYLKPNIEQVFSVFGSLADFKNPFITNYETRKEKTFGSRTYFRFSEKDKIRKIWHYTIGAEFQKTLGEIHNFDNHLGEKGSLQASDQSSSYQFFLFNHIHFKMTERLSTEASVSLNFAGYRFLNSLNNDFIPQLMPRFALSYQVHSFFSLRALVSRGFSAPTIAEIRPSDNQIYSDLHPEKGWNYEAGFRLKALQKRLWIDVSAFYYHLEQAIVRRENADGTEFFINSGGTVQPGLESYVYYQIFQSSTRNPIIQNLKVFNSLSWNAFTFQNYQGTKDDYSGNWMTGVPRVVVSSGIQMKIKSGFNFIVRHNYTGKIPLNDKNSFFSLPYHLIYAKVSAHFDIRKTSVDLFAAADNILNQNYSLGNDLNAFGNRYFNAAPLRSFTIGLQFSK